MPANKNALIRYKTIDNCLRNRYRRWTLDDLVEACCDALYDMEGISKGVSVRTVQGDIQMMRSDKLGYYAPIEVYDNKYYRYSDPHYSIMDMPMSQNDYEVMQEAIDMLRQLQDFTQFQEMADVVSRLQDKLAVSQKARKPLINFDNVPDLRGLQLLNPLYNIIVHQQVVKIKYQSFSSRHPKDHILCPHLLKEFRNRWFLFGTLCYNSVGEPVESRKLFNLPLDRIEGYEVMPDLEYHDNPDFDTEHFFDDVIGVTKDIGNKPQHIVFWANQFQSKYIKTKPIHPSQKLISQDKDGCCTFSIDVVINMELYSVMMSYGSGVKILEPEKSAKFIHDIMKKAVQQYESHFT